MVCPYCFSKLSNNSDLKKCNVCSTQFSNRLSSNLTSNDINLTLIGVRKSGKTTFLSVLFYLIEELLSQKTDIVYEYLDNKGFSYIFENVKRLQKGEKIAATGLNADALLVVLFRNFFYKKFICSFLDTPGELIENDRYLLELSISDKLFRSQNIFILIDSENFFYGDNMFYTGFISRFLELREKKKHLEKQNVYLIFTKADKIYNLLYKYGVDEYISFYKELKNSQFIDLEKTYEKLDYFSEKIKNVIKNNNKKNFFNIIENNFNGFHCFFVSALGEEKGFNKEKEFGVLNPLIHLVGKNYNSDILIQITKLIKNLIWK